MSGWRVLKGVLLVSCLLIVNACDTVNTKVGGALNLDTDLKLQIVVDSDINPDESGTPSPLFVRLYELKSTKMIERADFIRLYESDVEALGADFIAKQELKRLTPGENSLERIVLSKETQFVALYAEFFKYKNARYKVVFPVSANNVIRNSVKVRISANDLVLVK